MADFTQIIQEINADITTNGVGAITGAKLNEVLRDMIAAVNAEKQDPFTIDATPTEGSTNPVQSGGVYEALEHKPTIYHITNIQAIPPTIISILRVGDILRSGGEHDSIAVVCQIDNNDIYFVSTDGNMVETFLYRNGVFYDYFAYQLSELANKVPDATQGDLAGLDSDGNLTDSGIAASDVATTSDLAGKQDVISDLATIRSGAAAGATAYQKPSGGIPKTDLASGVQTSLEKADTALQSYTETDPVFSASPAAGITSGNISSWNGKAEPIEIVDASTPPMTMQPDKVYQYGTLSGDTTFPLLLFINDGKAHIHCWTFATPNTAPTITWPVAITAWAGGSAPTIAASKNYEVSVMDGIATIIEA